MGVVRWHRRRYHGLVQLERRSRRPPGWTQWSTCGARLSGSTRQRCRTSSSTSPTTCRVSTPREITGPFRLGWGMDYPHPQNYWQQLLDSRFEPPAGSNSTFYENPEFDAKIDEANAEADINNAIPSIRRRRRLRVPTHR